jgi:hypothetical protein
MAHVDPSEERHLQYAARAEEARLKAELTNDPVIRAWWEQVEKAWRFIAAQAPMPPGK